MAKIALVTDSTADLTGSMVKECDVYVLPLKIHFGEQQYNDGELASDDFYQRLKNGPELPRSSQPSPEEFGSLYQQLLCKYDEVISIHLSNALSGTVNSARIAAQTIKEKVHVVDSRNISLGIALMVKEAAYCIRSGMDAPQIINKLQTIRNNIETIFTLDTLEYLQKGGRIGKAAGLIGSMLSIKPIIRVNEEGIYIPAGKVRSQSKALEQIIKNFCSLRSGRKVKTLAVAHGAALEAANKLKAGMENAFEIPVSIFTHVGGVVGVHTGPGTVGAAVEFE